MNTHNCSAMRFQIEVPGILGKYFLFVYLKKGKISCVQLPVTNFRFSGKSPQPGLSW